MEHLLKRKVRYFFTSLYRERADVHDTLQELEGYGRLVLFGGMLRDLALSGNLHFRSDLDFVIDPLDLNVFEEWMSSIGAKVNRFGGYSLPNRKWPVDVWPLQKTWAHTAGHIKVKAFEDLKDATFFNCDAILYDIQTKKLNAKHGYFDDLHNKVLEINLRPNPNPMGNAVRAFRYAAMKKFRWGPKLTQFVAETVDKCGWDGLIEREKKSYDKMCIPLLDHRGVETRLQRHLSEEDAGPFDLSQHWTGVQFEFSLGSETDGYVPRRGHQAHRQTIAIG